MVTKSKSRTANFGTPYLSHEKINNIGGKYLNVEGNLGAACQLYLNSLNNSPLTSFDE